MSATAPTPTDALVLSYLSKRGFMKAAAELSAAGVAMVPGENDVRAIQASLALKITLFDGTENYVSAYKALRDWVHGSLDLYKARAAKA